MFEHQVTNKREMWWRHKINHIFGPFVNIVRKKLHHWIPEMILNQTSVFYFKNVEFWKLTFFDPFLNDLQVKY